MALLRILHYPDPFLKKPAEPVSAINGDINALARDMAETMYAAPGVGLAAPQVGVGRRVLVLDCSRKEEPPNLITAINPEIVSQEGTVFEEEGCLSVPEYYARITRSATVQVRYLDLKGQTVELTAEGLLSIAFQHEIDHLDGILFIDHLSPLKKGIFRKKYQKLLEQRQEQL